MSLRSIMAAVAPLVLASCAGLHGDGGGLLPFKVGIIPFEVAVVSPAGESKDDRPTLEPAFESANFIQSIRDALGVEFTEVVVLPSPQGVSVEEFRRWSPEDQDRYWMRACAAVDADLVLECDVKVSKQASYAQNEKFWLNLPLFLLGGPLCYFVNDMTYEDDARLRAALHQVLPIQRGRATLANGYAEVTHCDVKFDGVSLDFLDRTESISLVASLVVPPGFLARSNARVCNRFASEVSSGLAVGLAREIEESSSSILESESLADFYLTRDVSAVTAGVDVRVDGEIKIRGSSAADMREYTIVCGEHRVTGALGPAKVDPFLSTDREQVYSVPFSETIPRDGGGDRVRIELVQGGREQIERTFTVPVSAAAAHTSRTDLAPQN